MQNAVAVYGAVIKSHGLYGSRNLSFDYIAMLVKSIKRNRMSDWDICRTFKNLSVIRKHKNNFAVLNHGFNAEKRAIDKPFNEAIILFCGSHALFKVFASLIRCVAFKYAAAAHLISGF